MFQVITTWNFASLEKDSETAINSIKKRGYNKETFLTGELVAHITNRNIKPLSVSDIADNLCPSRRDLYLKKGKNRGPQIRRETWGGIAGEVVEDFSFNLFNKFYKSKNLRSYPEIITKTNSISKKFKNKKLSRFQRLEKLKSRQDEEPYWLLKLLTYNSRAELGLGLLHRMLLNRKSKETDAKDLNVTSCKLNPDPIQIGISKPATPDFLIERYGIVGDIKSGLGGFKDRYLLTCAGYALAYENEKRTNINFGIIYFFPTRHSERAKPVSFGQVYIFPIDDALREYFIDIRNAAYGIISKDNPPNFPDDKSFCQPYCQFYDNCKSQGLNL